MTHPSAEAVDFNSRLLKSSLLIEESRAFWAHTDGSTPASATQAFSEYWFGARSHARVETLLSDLNARYRTFPAALPVLHNWPDMSPDIRRLICHWHLQLADPLYRRFTGDFLVDRRQSHHPEVTRDVVTRWVTDHGPPQWTLRTRLQCAGKLLTAAHSAGLVTKNRDPRPLGLPRVPDPAVEYLLYLLRETTIEGTLRDNPYLRSVGLDPFLLDARLRTLPSLTFQSQGSLIDLHWQYRDLRHWGESRLGPTEARVAAGGSR